MGQIFKEQDLKLSESIIARMTYLGKQYWDLRGGSRCKCVEPAITYLAIGC